MQVLFATVIRNPFEPRERLKLSWKSRCQMIPPQLFPPVYVTITVFQGGAQNMWCPYSFHLIQGCSIPCPKARFGPQSHAIQTTVFHTSSKIWQWGVLIAPPLLPNFRTHGEPGRQTTWLYAPSHEGTDPWSGSEPLFWAAGPKY